jgi:tetratricopeptide (TPR) repeat protein
MFFLSSCDSSNNFDHQKNIKDNLEKLNSDPGNCSYLQQIGASYSALKKYDDAIKYYFETINNCPDNFSVLFQIGTSYFLAGETNKAFEFMDKAISKANELGEKEFADLYIKEKNEWLKHSQNAK